MNYLPLRAILLICTLAMGGCVTMPPELAAGGPFLDITPAQALGGEFEGRRVRWGGVVVQTRPMGKGTCFEMMGLKLDALGEPLGGDHSLGRFLACATGFYDPAIYSQGRYVTFTGRIEGVAPQMIGDAEYRFPKLTAGQVYLWPKHSDVLYVPYPVPGWGPYYDPYYWPYERYR